MTLRAENRGFDGSTIMNLDLDNTYVCSAGKNRSLLSQRPAQAKLIGVGMFMLTITIYVLRATCVINATSVSNNSLILYQAECRLVIGLSLVPYNTCTSS